MHCGSGQSFRGYLVVTSYHRGAGTGGGGGHHADTLGRLGVVRGLVGGLQKAGQYNIPQIRALYYAFTLRYTLYYNMQIT